ncbi:hypothetical protein PENSPDRAFT_609718 [Peniophora sp. CONT]|nr:hypothetical protein PENSPDRAFT_609718 [Peniophora sp. CONT]
MTTSMREIDYAKLFSNELRWRDRQLFLQSKGYMLRPRLRPGWVPSWLMTGEDPMDCEDGESLPARSRLVDATRISDGKMVYIKCVNTGDLESQIACALSSDALRRDPRNHSVPIEDVFADDEDPSVSYLVMPFLRRMNSPEFETVGEVVDFVDQILEGLAFMHEQGVAHRDCAAPNIMCDASAMFPRGFHPINQYSLFDDIKTGATILPRATAGVRYYFIDYGISSYFPPGRPRELVTGIYGREQDVPELSSTKPYDPFAVDIFILGSLFKKEFCKKYSRLHFLEPVANAANARDPASRPTAIELLHLWQAQKRRVTLLQSPWYLSRRILPVDGSLVIIPIPYMVWAIALLWICLWAYGTALPGI